MKSPLEAVLRAQSLSVLELAKALGVGVREANKALRASRSVHNVGTVEYPIWTWKIGSTATAEELLQTVRRLLSERPMSRQQLVDATGVSAARVSNTIRKLAKTERFTLYGKMLFLNVR